MWLFDRRTDLLVFGGSAALALAAWAALHAMGLAEASLPAWGFLLLVVGVDVAHVWSTIYRVHLDDEELPRRSGLYVGVPVLLYGVGVVLHLHDSLTFWRALAYVAVFHFVRQQYGWVMWYRRGEPRGARKLVDGAAIYSATLGPLVWWHANLPRPFHWFVADDFFVGLPSWAGQLALGGEGLCLLVYVLTHAHARGPQPWGKHLVVGSTAVCWFVSIVLAGGDLAFTVVNVIPHGIPYLVLCRRYAAGRTQGREPRPGLRDRLFRAGWTVYLATVVLLAYVEEATWDALVWHEHGALFGGFAFELTTTVTSLVVPLLALPQAAHYVLDGFIWRAGPANPLLGPALASGAGRTG